MSDPFIAEIRIFAGDFAPKNWAFCNGQLMPISQNTALFSLLGTTYGGDGRVTYALPDMQGRAPMHFGQGPGLTDRMLGEMGGTDTVTLLQTEMPMHNHALNATTSRADTNTPGTDNAPGRVAGFTPYGAGPGNVAMSPNALAPAGGSTAHQNMQPYLGLNFIIALYGIYPQRG